MTTDPLICRCAATAGAHAARAHASADTDARTLAEALQGADRVRRMVIDQSQDE